MGGAASAVQLDSRDIFLESAFFAPEAITGRARQYGLHTDSSFRFERGVDPLLQQQAIERATALLLDIVGGQAGSVILHSSEQHIPALPAMVLRATRVEQILGIAIPDSEIEAILSGLGMVLKHVSQGIWQVTPPSYRFDIRIEADLIEELVRLYGYERLETVHMQSAAISVVQSEIHIPLARFRQVLVDRGYQEAITYSFVDPQLQHILHPNSESFALLNPISPELSVMRVSLWSGLLTALQYNYNRQQSRIRLFETGLYFHPESDKQEPSISGAIIGSVFPEQWGSAKQSADFFDIKNDIEALLALTGTGRGTSSREQFIFEPKKRNAFHPQQASCIKKNGKEIGWVGRLNPAIEQKLGITEPVYLFELVLNEINQAVKPVFKPLPKFPSVRRDIAILVDKTVSAAAIKQSIQKISKNHDLLDQILFFDVYQGKGIPDGQQSIALGLVFQAPSRTLTDDEVNVQMGQITDILQQDLNATLRS
jgi:phenylalanyl-tRNA synthetase beta chain